MSMPPPPDARPYLTLIGSSDEGTEPPTAANELSALSAGGRPRLSLETPADAIWSVLQSPPSPCGVLVYVRLMPSQSPRTLEALQAAARSCAPFGTQGEPILLPATPEEGGAGTVVIIAYCGAFNMADLAALRARVEHALTDLTRPRPGSSGGGASGNVTRAELAGPYTWWLPGSAASTAAAASSPADVSAAGGGGTLAAYPGDTLERLLMGAAAKGSGGGNGTTIAAPGLRVALQPVVSLQDGTILGYEALCRGESGLARERPLPLFAWAERLGRARDFDTLCQRAALTASRTLFGRRASSSNGPAPRLFVNLHPASLPSGADLAAVERMPLFTEASRLSVAPGQVVVEIAERHAATDPAGFVRSLKALRDAGFALCLDDASGGHLTLQLTAELAPDFIKTDRALVRAIDHAPARRALLAVLAETASQSGARLIAKGIETTDEMAALIEMGVPIGQGFHLAPPAPELLRALPADRIQQMQISQERRRRRWSGGAASQTVGDLRIPLAPGRSLRPEDVIGEIESRVVELDETDGLPVLDEAGKPVGLLMRRALISRLAILHGPELLRKRHVTVVMDNRPLVMDAELPVDQAVRLLLAWGDGKMDDHILISDPAQNGICVGHLPARRLLEHMTQVQMRQARYANPLTGLPGNVPIEREVNTRLASGQAAAILYADLDDFKPYNDRYGVVHGDEVIRTLSEAILRATEEQGDPGDFVGHLGGDDFLVVTTPEKAPGLARAIVARFAERVSAFYTPEDRERGGMMGRDRYGAQTFFPFMSVSVAGVGNAIHPLRDFAHVSERLGPLKARAKAHAPGSRIVLEGMDESASA